MDLKRVKELSSRELLLSPLHLLHQFSTALLPGVLVLFILMMKHSRFIPAALSVTDMLGYKTRISLALLIALVMGRVVQSVALIVLKGFVSGSSRVIKQARKQKKKKAEEPPPIADDVTTTGTSATLTSAPGEPEVLPASGAETPPEKPTEPQTEPTQVIEDLTPQQVIVRTFFTSLLMGTVVPEDSSIFDAFEAHRSHSGLILSSGFVLFFASFYPGDGLRVYEFVGGVLLLIMGFLQGKEGERIRIEALGAAVGRFIRSHSIKDNIEILQTVHPLLPIVMKHINPTPTEKEPVQIVTELAEESRTKNNLHPKAGKKRRRR